MKGIKKLNIYHKMTAFLLAGTMAFSLSACNGHVDMKSKSPSNLLEIQEVKDITLLDELMAANELYYFGELDVVEAADQLERYLDIIDLLKKMDFSGVSELEPLTEEQYQEPFSLPLEEIEKLVEKATYKGKDLAQTEEKLIALKQLDHLYTECTNWVHQNGQDVSIAFMIASVKASLASELGLSTEEYSNIIIPPARRSVSNGPEPYMINVGNEHYMVPVGSGEIWNTMDYIYEVQGATLEGEKEYQTYRKSLNFGKTTIAAGSDIKKNNKVVEQNGESYIKKHILEK